ncbi:hypothetical protein Cal6303_2240 [Calothrix sp. PCC 6303]|nr:hypothetical protein Cal6303_2240 [Calothrix sp. PCC 6303]
MLLTLTQQIKRLNTFKASAGSNMQQNSYIAWEGNSLIDGSPIVLILTGFVFPSFNKKTGSKMIQSWILQQEFTPTHAAKEGLEVGICGSCPMRMSEIGSCYVNLLGVNRVYQKYKSGAYPKLSNNEIEVLRRYRYPIRLGSYGDPTAIPFDVWEPLILASGKHTGYTHRHENCDLRWQKYLMASVETETQARQAQSQGWRTFRIIAPDAPLSKNEILCRHTEDDTNQCETCLLCDGASSKPNIADKVHGLNWKVSNFLKYLESTSN